MGSGLLTAETLFVVGSVRASFWVEQSPANDAPAYRITVERRCEGTAKPQWTPALRLNDITPAILALKKANDYLKRRAVGPTNGQHRPALVARQAPRIP